MSNEDTRRLQGDEIAARMLKRQEVLAAAPLLYAFITPHDDSADSLLLQRNAMTGILSSLYQTTKFRTFEQFEKEYVIPKVAEAEEEKLYATENDLNKKIIVAYSSLIGFELAGVQTESGSTEELVDLFLGDIAEIITGEPIDDFTISVKGSEKLEVLRNWVKSRMMDGAQWRKEADKSDLHHFRLR